MRTHDELSDRLPGPPGASVEPPVVEFLVPPDEYERLSPSFDKSIDSLTLRDGG